MSGSSVGSSHRIPGGRKNEGDDGKSIPCQKILWYSWKMLWKVLMVSISVPRTNDTYDTNQPVRMTLVASYVLFSMTRQLTKSDLL